jgi:phosphatidylglycerol:prolipoprotein diacylglycerol transferase
LPFGLSPYVLLNGLGLIAGLFLLDQALERRASDVRDRAYVFFVAALVFGWFSARLLDGFVSAQPFARAGFTFYGGLVGGAAFYLCIASRAFTSDQLWRSINAAILPLLVAHAFGRLGCFLAGCCYGCLVGDGPHRHPTQLYEMSFLLLLAVATPHLERRCLIPPLHTYLVGYSAFRFLIEFHRADPRGALFSLSTSQWISLGLLGASAFLLATRRLTKSPNHAPECVKRFRRAASWF